MTSTDEHIARLRAGVHHDPSQILGRHALQGEEVVRAFVPDAQWARIDAPGLPMAPRGDDGVFEWRGQPGMVPQHHRIRWLGNDGIERCEWNPYSFSPSIADFDRHLFAEGRHRHAHRFLGAHCMTRDGVPGVRFAVWAPNARRVSVVGNFNRWDGRRHAMCGRSGGVWELFVPDLGAGVLYKYEVLGRTRERPTLKADPYGRRCELRPATASIVEADTSYEWRDAGWLERRRTHAWQHEPLSIYELHLGSWARRADGEFLSYREIAGPLVEHVTALGFTHVELMPITEHPYDASWGYQTTGYFAPSARFGDADGLRHLVDALHARAVGVILDWVPGHFPRDAHGLARFDGTALYEHADPRRGEHRDWGTLIFNFARNEVRSFLVSSALYWIENFHIDALRVDAVASMLYLDYSRDEGEWVPNRYGGNEDLEAIDFLRELNHVVHSEQPGVLTIAEESTAWPQVTRPPWVGGLGFSIKWNMGWMHDSLDYFALDPVVRKYHHDRLTFGIMYAASENFVLPFSHDEVVHGKRSLLSKMPGDRWSRFANLRLLYGYLFTYPGKKLLFMGSEFADPSEWSETRSLPWHLLEQAGHAGVRQLVVDLNRLYRALPALHRLDFDAHRGFEWIDCHDADQSVVSFIRRDEEGDFVVVCLNCTPVPRSGYRIGVPAGGRYRERFNSDAAAYGGSNVGNLGEVEAVATPWMGRTHSLVLTLPPLAALVLQPLPGDAGADEEAG